MQTVVDIKEMQSGLDAGDVFKRCPFCAERIQLQAIKCRFCGEFLAGSPPAFRPALKSTGKWYYSTAALAAALLTVGPLALPLVWANPKYKLWVKATISVAVVAFTLALCWAMARVYAVFMDQFRALGI